MESYKYTLIVLVFVALAAGGVYLATRKAIKSGRRSIWDYLFLWPLLTTKKTETGRDYRPFSKRELMGWGVVLILLIVAFWVGM
jgi:hypothetical protein